MDTIKFYVELVQGKDEVTDPIWMGRDNYYEIPIKFPNTPPIITRTPPTIALGDAPQPSGIALPIEAVIVDAVEPFVQSALLFYRHLDSASWDSVAMVNIADSTWRAEIPAEVVSPDSVYYYLFATDGELNGHAPDIAQPREKPFVIPVKTPNAPPIITRTPETVALGDSPRPVYSTLRIEAVIVDTLGPSVQSAMLYYRRPGQTLYDSLAMSHVADSTWRGDIPCSAVVPDSIYYYLSASDGDSTGYDPKSKPPGEPPYAIFVAGENPPPEIIHQPTPTATADSVIQVTALVSDATLYVATVELYYQNRRDGKNFKRMDMFNTGSDRYSVVIPGDVVIPPYVNYYIKAGDECQSTASTPIFHVLVDAGDVVMPNPFTPNGDGFNDYAFFNVPGLRQGRGRVNIYNLRGRLVRQLFDSGKWYGKDDSGAELPPGVYIYAVYVDGKRTSKGTLTLIR